MSYKHDEATGEFVIEPRGPFSLEVARTFSCGIFTASRACGAHADVRFAFSRDAEDFAVAGVSLRVASTGAVVGRAFGAPGDALAPQVARVLGLEHDARPFFAMAEREAAIGRALARHPGFRPVVFFSPYAAAGWAVISQRVRMSQAAALAREIALEAGDVVEVEGERLAAFPRPQTFLARASHPRVPAEKWSRLQGVARAALAGELALDRLRAEPYPVARERLMRLRGVGPWTADAVLMRGLGPTDALPVSEPTLHHAIAWAYGLATPPSDLEVARIAERWRPFRMWTSILLIMAHGRARATGEAPAVAFERGARAGRARRPAKGGEQLALG